MFDLETFGTAPGCAIRSIGAVDFDLTGAVGDTFYRNIKGMSCWTAGLSVDRSTVDWWDQQPKEVRDRLLEDQRELGTVVADFHRWFSKTGAARIWCQGAGFDEPIWQAACKALGRVPPWKYWNVRCTRTIYGLADLDTRTIPRLGDAHHALDDAKHQVACVQEAFKRIKNGQVSS